MRVADRRVERDDLERHALLLEQHDRVLERVGVVRVVGQIADQQHGAALRVLLTEHVLGEVEPLRDARAGGEPLLPRAVVEVDRPLPLSGGEKKRRNGFRSTAGEPGGSASYATSEKRTSPRRPFDAAIVESASSISQ